MKRMRVRQRNTEKMLEKLEEMKQTFDDSRVKIGIYKEKIQGYKKRLREKYNFKNVNRVGKELAKIENRKRELLKSNEIIEDEIFRRLEEIENERH